jgi:hypothetical protein
MNTLRHGDFTFYPTNESPTGEKIDIKGREFTFAEGEATGHFHTIHVPAVDDMECYKQADGSYMVVMHKEGYATHPEHSLKNDLVIPIGTYHLKQRREKDWFSLNVRRVLD